MGKQKETETFNRLGVILEIDPTKFEHSTNDNAIYVCDYGYSAYFCFIRELYRDEQEQVQMCKNHKHFCLVSRLT